MKTNNVYQMVADRIVAELNNGIIPWHRPWSGAPDGAYNYDSRKPYSYLNQMLLKHRGEYLTFNQIQQHGGKIRKGERAEMVVFYKPYVKEEIKPDGTKDVVSIPVLRYYLVYHISQVDGIESKATNQDTTPALLDEQEQIINDYVTREHLGFVNNALSNNAYYDPDADMVQVPMISQYKDVSEYYSTTFHELAHSTGHASRLNRKGITEPIRFGSETYSREELVAEMGSAMLCNVTGIEIPSTFRNSAAYIQGWSRKIKGDPKLFVTAAAQAEKAAKYIINGKESES